MSVWTVIPDFDGFSLFGGKCPVTGGIKKPGDPGVLRGPDIQTFGILDISWSAALEMVQTIGGLGPADTDRLRAELAGLKAANADLQERNDELEALFAAFEKAKVSKR